MRTTWKPFSKKTKLTFLFPLTFLFLFSDFLYGAEPEVYKEYWDNGKLKKETHFKNGKEEGIVSVWYKNGKIQTKGHYKNGKLNGLLYTWYKNGQKMSLKALKIKLVRSLNRKSLID